VTPGDRCRDELPVAGRSWYAGLGALGQGLPQCGGLRLTKRRARTQTVSGGAHRCAHGPDADSPLDEAGEERSEGNEHGHVEQPTSRGV
jgi:hypothetical protein